MPSKLKIEGFGEITLKTIKIEDKQYEEVDSNKNPVTKIKGSFTPAKYINKEGVEIPQSAICKLIEIDGESYAVPKFAITKEVKKDEYEVIDTSEAMVIINNAIEKKFYKVLTDVFSLKKLLFEENKALKFPVTFGNGWKSYVGILTTINEHIVLIGVIGNIAKELQKLGLDETISLEIEVPETQKKVIKNLAMATL